MSSQRTSNCISIANITSNPIFGITHGDKDVDEIWHVVFVYCKQDIGAHMDSMLVAQEMADLRRSGIAS